MITFLPYPDFYNSLNCLDYQWKKNRLENQLHESVMILEILLGYRKPSNHPVVKMWKSNEESLYRYAGTCLSICRIKRLKEYPEITEKLCNYGFVAFGDRGNPEWLFDERLHSSHRAILLGKNFKYYSQFGWSENPAKRDGNAKWPYYWPVK